MVAAGKDGVFQQIKTITMPAKETHLVLSEVPCVCPCASALRVSQLLSRANANLLLIS